MKADMDRLELVHDNRIKRLKTDVYRDLFSEVEHVEIKCVGGQRVKFLKPLLKKSPVFREILEGDQALEEIAIKYTHETVEAFSELFHYGIKPQVLNLRLLEELIDLMDKYDCKKEFEDFIPYACKKVEFEISLETCEQIKKMLLHIDEAFTRREFLTLWRESEMRKRILNRMKSDIAQQEAKMTREFEEKLNMLKKENKKKMKDI